MTEAMIADKDYIIPVNAEESVKLIQQIGRVEFVFGTGGCALVWKKGEPLSPAIALLGLMRGVTNENMNGAGI
jgi:hypothetical protein